MNNTRQHDDKKTRYRFHNFGFDETKLHILSKNGHFVHTKAVKVWLIVSQGTFLSYLCIKKIISLLFWVKFMSIYSANKKMLL
jgi:hypothetical protein